MANTESFDGSDNNELQMIQLNPIAMQHKSRETKSVLPVKRHVITRKHTTFREADRLYDNVKCGEVVGWRCAVVLITMIVVSAFHFTIFSIYSNGLGQTDFSKMLIGRSLGQDLHVLP